MPEVDMTNLNAYYSTTTPGTTIQSGPIDPALQSLVIAINDNYALFQNLISAMELPIPDQSIVTRHLRNLAVTNPKLAPLAVTADKIADGSIMLSKLADLVVTAAKIANYTLTENKYASGSVSGRAIAPGAVSSTQLDQSLFQQFGNIALNARFENIEDHSVLYTKINLTKESYSLTCSGSQGSNQVTISSPSSLVSVGDTVAIQGAGTKKNNAAFLINITNVATSNGNVTITINGTPYTIAVITSDTASAIVDKIVAILPYSYVSKGNYVLYDSGSTAPITISFNFSSTGMVMSSKIDNTIRYNVLRSTIIGVNGTLITIADNLQRAVTGAFIKADHTELIRSALTTSSYSHYRIWIEEGTYNVFDKMAVFVGKTGISIRGNGDSSFINAEDIVGVYTPYYFSGEIFYYTDGQLFTFTSCNSMQIKDIRVSGNYQSLFIFHNTSNVKFENVTLDMVVANNVNHTQVGVYSDAGENTPKGYTFKGCRFTSGGNAIITIGDFSNPVQNVSVENCTFDSLASGNFGSLELAEMVKFDTGTREINISNNVFVGGHLSALTIEEGCEHVVVSDNFFKNASYQFLRIGSGQTNVSTKYVDIHHNQFDTATFAIRASSISSGYNVENLKIRSNTYSACEVAVSLNNCRSVRIEDETVHNANLTASSSISLAKCEGVEVKDLRIPNFASENIFQLYTTECTDVTVRDSFLYTMQNTLTTNGLIFNNNILCRQSLINNYSVDMFANHYNKALLSTSQCLKIESTISATDNGVYKVYFNKFYSSPGLVVAVGSGLQKVDKNYNIEAVDDVISYTWNPASIATGSSLASPGISVPGCVFGDAIDVSAPYSLLGMGCTAYVSNTNFVQIVLTNLTGASVDLASGVWKLKIRKI